MTQKLRVKKGLYRFTCSLCQNEGEITASTVYEAKDAAFNAGWGVAGGGEETRICPRCVSLYTDAQHFLFSYRTLSNEAVWELAAGLVANIRKKEKHG